MPSVIIIAGPNGAGKSTAAPILLKEAANIDNFVNADQIALGLCAFQPEKAAMEAGRIMLNRLHALAAAKETFAFETTLASRSFAPWIAELRQQGYKLHLFFLWLNSPELAIARVAERVRLGGHSVPKETIIRRYKSGIKNFFKLYQPLADNWQLYDNSNEIGYKLISSGEGTNKLVIKNKLLWKKVLELSNEK